MVERRPVSERRCAAESRAVSRAIGPSRRGDMNCSACKSSMRSLGQLPIRVGGTSGGWHLLFGNLAEVSEDVVALDCDACKRVEFFDLDLSLPSQR